MHFRLRPRTLLILGLLLASLTLLGCDKNPSADSRSVSDPNDVMHFKVPKSWQVNTDEGFVFVYAGKQLPAENERATALSMIVMSSRTASDSPEAEMIDYLVDSRAAARRWTDVKAGNATAIELGGRPAVRVDVSAKDASGKRFESRYVFARSGGSEVFVAAIGAPGKTLDEYEDDLERIYRQWYWHVSADATSTATETTR